MGLEVAVLDASGFTPPYDYHLCSGLAEHVDHVELITSQTFPEYETKNNFTISEHFYRFYNSTDVTDSKSIKGVEHVWDMIRLLQYLKSINPDVLHVQWAALPLVDRWFFKHLQKRFPVVLTVHDTNPFHGSPGTQLQLLQFTETIEEFDRWIVHTGYSKTILEREYGLPSEQISIVPHGILQYPDTNPVNKSDKFEILYFGNIKEYKGVDTLLRAIGRLSEHQLNRVQVRIAGNPQSPIEPYKQLATSLGIDNVISWELGFVPDSEVPALFKNADALVLPYREIDQSGVFMTAIDYSVPIIASDVGGFNDLLTDRENALLFDPESPGQLGECITELAENEEVRKRLESGTDRFAASVPSWSEIGNQTLSVYRSLI